MFKLRVGAFVFLAFAAMGCVQAQIDMQRSYIATEKKAYFLLPPEFVCGPNIKTMVWSPDGLKFAILREFKDTSNLGISDLAAVVSGEPLVEPQRQLLVWSAVTRKTTTLMNIVDRDTTIDDILWLAGSSSLIITGSFHDPSSSTPNLKGIKLVSASGATRMVAEYEQAEGKLVMPAPATPVAVFIEYPQRPKPVAGEPAPKRPPASFRFFGVDGLLGKTLTMPSGYTSPIWGLNGLLYLRSNPGPVGSTRGAETWFEVNPSNPALTRVDPPSQSALEQFDVQAELQVENFAGSVNVKPAGVQAPTLIITAPNVKDSEPAVVSTDASDGGLSPKFNAVVFSTPGGLMVRPMVAMTLEDYRKAKLEALRQKIVKQAKYVATALAIYCGDYDNVFPAKGADLQSLLDPYCKCGDMMNGFVYTFAGGPASGITNPSQTEIGYIVGPGGRAVTYADSSTRWIPDP